MSTDIFDITILSSALLGKKVGDIASFETPGGMVQMKILKIS